MVERRAMVGGVCVNTGTIPSKTLREAVVYLTGMSEREMYGQSYRVKADITMEDLASGRTASSLARSTSSAISCSETTSSCCKGRRDSSTSTSCPWTATAALRGASAPSTSSLR